MFVSINPLQEPETVGGILVAIEQRGISSIKFSQLTSRFKSMPENCFNSSSGSGQLLRRLGEKSWYCPKYPIQEFILNEAPIGDLPEIRYASSPGSR